MRLSVLLAASIVPLVFAVPTLEIRSDPVFENIGIVPKAGSLVREKVFDEMIAYFESHSDIRAAFPGLRTLLKLAKNDSLSEESLLRGMLFAIKGHSIFGAARDKLQDLLKKDLDDFIDGNSPGFIFSKREFVIPPSPAAKEHFARMEETGRTSVSRRWLNEKRQTTPVIYENEAKTRVMAAHVAAQFHNWGLTVHNTPAYTFVPTTVYGLSQLVLHAKKLGKRVRAAGYRHTWTPLYSENNEIFVSMLDLKTATAVPDPSSLLPDEDHSNNEFKTIELLDYVPGSNRKKRLARIGAAVTNEELRRWAVRGDHWTLPVNVVLVEITLGGSNTPICHGGGIRHKTLSDLVRKIEYIDAHGIPRSVTDSEQLKAAAGSFGLLGIVTHITFELDKMTYANIAPEKTDINLAIPPPPGFTVPKDLAKAYTLAQLEAARKEFIELAEKRYYSEWFWFPYQQEAYVNCWDNVEPKPAGTYNYPTYPDVFLQWVQGWLGGVINDDPLFRKLPGHWQATLLGSSAMLALPVNNVRTHLPNALHFRRGVQNMRVRDVELQIPVPALASDPTEPDWSVVQRAWWDAIAEVYADPRAPMRVALEMRIMADSNMILAPQRGNRFGTASIEVLTTLAAADDGSWGPFAQKVVDRWMAYTDATGARLNTRSHWAKEWDGLTVEGMPWRRYIKEVSYRREIPEFREALAGIGAATNVTLKEMQQRFSNSLLDEVIFS